MTIFDKSQQGRHAFKVKQDRVSCIQKNITNKFRLPAESLREEELDLPEVSELDITRHYTGLSRENYGVDNGFYPLGSCTMKYNPKINEYFANKAEFRNVHPLQLEKDIQGYLKLYYDFQQILSELFGLADFTLYPCAGAHGEYVALKIMAKYFQDRKDHARKTILIPDSAHGTNPASARLAGFDVTTIHSNSEGEIDLKDLEEHMNEAVAGIMLTNPNTLGIFESKILEIREIIHAGGGLLYYDGANANAILGKARIGDMGFDICHLNLHKTFSTPHGMGGPGSGPVGVTSKLVPYLPNPHIIKNGETFSFGKYANSIGRIHSFYGNANIIVRAFVYTLMLGLDGLKEVSEVAVLNSNYLFKKLKKYFATPYLNKVLHEFTVSASNLKDKNGITAFNIAKSLLDYGFHAPTVYFPLIVNEALMIEPTETESKTTLDNFIKALEQILQKAESDPDYVKHAPHSGMVSHLDEAEAARKPILNYEALKNTKMKKDN